MSTKDLFRRLARETRPSMKRALTVRLKRRLKKMAPHEIIELVLTKGPSLMRFIPEAEEERQRYTSFPPAAERKEFNVQAWLNEPDVDDDK